MLIRTMHRLLWLMVLSTSAVFGAGQTDYVLTSDSNCERTHDLRTNGSRIERCGGPFGLRSEYYLCRTTPAVRTEPKNLAENRSRTGYPAPAASSTFAGYDVWSPLDGNENSWSNASSDGDSSTWDLDFGKPVRVGKVIIKTWKDYALKDFDLLRWDDKSNDWAIYNPVARIRGNTRPQVVITNLNLTTRKFRVHCLSGPDHQAIFRRISEFEAYAPPAPVRHFEPRWFSYRVRVPKTGQWTLEVQEVNDDRHNGDRTCYQILVDGKKVHVRDYRDTGPGLVTYFVDVPAHGKDSATVIFKDTSGYGMRIRSLRVYADFPGYCRKNRFAEPMLLCPRVFRFDPAKGLDTSLMERWVQVFEKENARDKLGFVVDFAYLQKGQEWVRKLTDAAGKLMTERDIPLILGYTTWWSFSPLQTPDGAGGKFGDIQYQQIGYSEYDTWHDPGLKEYMDRCKPGWYDVRYGLTIPNHWSNVPWLTMNNKRLNGAKQSGLAQSITKLNRWLMEMERQGKLENLLGIIGDDEPVYWTKIVDVFSDGYGSVNNGVPRTDLLLDFNWSVIQDAARDGVILNPKDGLDEKEKQWLHLNPAHYNRLIISTIRNHLRKPALLVKGKHVQAPKYGPAENLYVYITGGPGYPLNDTFHPIWETEIFPEARVGLGKDIRAYERGREMGRVVNSDFECAGSTPEKVQNWIPLIRNLYESGARFIHFTNPGDPENWASMARFVANPTQEMERKRFESLLISWRRDAMDLIAELDRKPTVDFLLLDQARQSLRDGRYRDAYEQALRAKLTMLPANYRILQPGALSPYPVIVEKADSPVDITLRSIGKNLSLDSTSEESFRLRISDLQPKSILLLRPGNRIAGVRIPVGPGGSVSIDVPAGNYTLETAIWRDE